MTYKVGVFGIAHSHARLLIRDFLNLGDKVDLIGYTDFKPCNDFQGRIKESLTEGQIPTYYENPNDLVALKPDIGIVCCDNASHLEVASLLMENGIIPIIEKPLAISIDDAIGIYEKSLETGVEFVTNWPVAWFPPFIRAKSLLKDGVIGKPLRFHYRTTATLGPYCHQGPVKFDEYECSSWWFNKERGGGAMIDYCCYGSALAAHFFEECPYEVYGLKRRFILPDRAGDVEDYAMIIMQFDDKVGYAEGSWSSPSIGSNKTGPIIYGTKGVLVCNRYDNNVSVFTDMHSTKPEISFDFNERAETVAENMISHLENGTPFNPMLLPKVNLWAAAILDAGKHSAESNMPEKVINYFNFNK